MTTLAKTPVERALEAWNGAPPDWVVTLAEACNATSQNKVAVRLERSASLVSAVLSNKYKGDLKAVEDLVRGAFEAVTVQCPALGRIPTDECRHWQTKARDFVNVNALRVQMYRACKNCPRAQKESKS